MPSARQPLPALTPAVAFAQANSVSRLPTAIADGTDARIRTRLLPARRALPPSRVPPLADLLDEDSTRPALPIGPLSFSVTSSWPPAAATTGIRPAPRGALAACADGATASSPTTPQSIVARRTGQSYGDCRRVRNRAKTPLERCNRAWFRDVGDSVGRHVQCSFTKSCAFITPYPVSHAEPYIGEPLTSALPIVL